MHLLGLIGHIRADTPTGKTFLITCETYQMLLGVQQIFFTMEPESCPHSPKVNMSKITFIWESMKKFEGYILMPKMWLPQPCDTPCIMDLILQSQERPKGTVKCIRDETISLVRAVFEICSVSMCLRSSPPYHNELQTTALLTCLLILSFL